MPPAWLGSEVCACVGGRHYESKKSCPRTLTLHGMLVLDCIALYIMPPDFPATIIVDGGIKCCEDVHSEGFTQLKQETTPSEELF